MPLLFKPLPPFQQFPVPPVGQLPQRRPALSVEMNTWEEQALRHNTTSGQPRDPKVYDSLIYPGLYSSSGIDILTILATIHTRPNPTIPLGAVDSSCALLVCDLTQPDQPIVYASDEFTVLTGYTAAEVTGRNCRFLQAPPQPPTGPPPPFFTLPSPPPASFPPLLLPTGFMSGPLPFPVSPPLALSTTGSTSPPTSKHVPRQEQVQYEQQNYSLSSTTPFPNPFTNPSPPQEPLPFPQPPRRQQHHHQHQQQQPYQPPNAVNAIMNPQQRDYGYGVDQAVIHKMKRAVQTNREVQVEVVNYKKSGEAFVNLLTIIPVWVPGWKGGAAAHGGGGKGQGLGLGGLGKGLEQAQVQGMGGFFNLSVGFLCDFSSLEE